MAKETSVAKNDSTLAVVKLAAIQAGLPKNCKATNNKAVEKTVREIDSSIVEKFWTSWYQNCTSKGLALLKPNGKVKLIPEEEYQNYEVNGKPLGQ